MNRIGAHLLIILFSSFITCISLDFSSYLRMVNAGATADNVTNMPEEPHEDAGKVKHYFKASPNFAPSASLIDEEYYINQSFKLAEQIYFDVPYSPPDLV